MSEPAAVALGPDQRRAGLERLRRETLDLLVIGGGVTGAGVALDAAARRLSVGLVEADDLAAGTSSRSSKLIHGGLRYLEQLDIALVREALRERSLLLDRLCPHLVRPIPFLLPLRHRVWERAYLGAGVALYDTLGGRRGLPAHRHLSRRAALERWPALRPDRLVGAIQYWDGQVDDARHTLFVARTAASLGAAIVTGAAATQLVREGGRVVGARVRDLDGGAEMTVRARAVVSATGVWTERVASSVSATGLTVRASKGVHLVVPRDRIDAGTGLIVRTETSVLFVIPWGSQHWIIGTTDTPWGLDVDVPAATRRDVDYLLDHANAELVHPLSHDDVVGVYVGLRPLLSGRQAQTAKLSREHAVSTPLPGLVEIAGGKYTTYRVMAADAVDAAVATAGIVAGASRTATIPLVGAAGYRERWARRAELAAAHGLGVAQVERLLGRYGALVDDLFELFAADPSAACPVGGSGSDGAGGGGYLRAELAYAVTHEGARSVADLLERRTRLAIETPDRGVRVAGEAARLLGGVLGWDRDRCEAEQRRYVRRVDAQRRAEEAGDDEAALVALAERSEHAS
jgi:glycerol-3-phosphate dehydrogenase